MFSQAFVIEFFISQLRLQNYSCNSTFAHSFAPAFLRSCAVSDFFFPSSNSETEASGLLPCRCFLPTWFDHAVSGCYEKILRFRCSCFCCMKTRGPRFHLSSDSRFFEHCLEFLRILLVFDILDQHKRRYPLGIFHIHVSAV